MTFLLIFLILFISLVCIIFLARATYQNFMTQLRIGKYIELCMTDMSPMIQKLRIKIAETPDKELQSLNIKDLISKEALNMLEEVKNFVKDIGITAQDPENKIRAEKMTVEIESMLNLMATVDDKSSPEHVTQVCREILTSIEKMKNNE